jgi:type 1 glutamine amidotransferase
MYAWGFDVVVESDLDALRDAAALAAYRIVVPLWTLGRMTDAQEEGLVSAVAGGVGLGGFHGMCGAFCDNLRYKWMTGGQLVAHPRDTAASYRVTIVDRDHPVTRGVEDFDMTGTEQYYLHVDPTNHVLATTRFEDGSVIPAAWTRRWGEGRVFYLSVGHSPRDFVGSEPMELLRRGLCWAAGVEIPEGT